ncbi:helix-turn-helix domain-containing protein [Leptolyngbya sp. FACHB-36]|nr:helix-turn-helix domain-containing protein [Leptolyngbya sp. FACHB-36]
MDVSRLKNQDTLPHVGARTLDAICWYLDCTPADLIEYVRDVPLKQGEPEDEKSL